MTVEADIHTGLPAFTIVGLGDAAVQESRERVRAALVNSGFEFPLRRITVNLAPADLRKAGPAFDLALAAALLAASGQARARAARDARLLRGARASTAPCAACAGAIAMAGGRARGRLRGHRGAARRAPAEAALVGGLEVVPVATCASSPRSSPGDGPPAAEPVDARRLLAAQPRGGEDFAQVRGHRGAQAGARGRGRGRPQRADDGAAGSGKSMAARRLPSIMPPLDARRGARGDARAQRRRAAGRGAAGRAAAVSRAAPLDLARPGWSAAAARPRPGEASLAQHGVLFLDELSEFARPALEALRQPLEEGCVRDHARPAHGGFPARFLLVAATNPCPCGYHGDPRRAVHLPPGAAARYRARLSGPLLDRIDIVLRVEQPPARELIAGGGAGGLGGDPRARDRRPGACSAQRLARHAGHAATPR